MNAVTRKFDDVPAVRGPTPLLLGLIGPSGSGKTYSALRLATGMQEKVGGEIFVIDTESRRSLHYAKNFNFRHVEFKAPFSPLDYLAAIQHCLNKGAKTIIVDSMSHEHEGPGGVLEWHAQEVERIMAAWRCSEDKANIPAWNKPKAARRRLINSIIQMDCNFIFCFRAKDKVKIGKGTVSQLGFMPIAGEEFVFELTAKCLLLPGANGIPTWKSDNVGEQLMIKLPEQFRALFTGAAGKQLDENVGRQLAEWAAGDEVLTLDELLAEYEKVTTKTRFTELERHRGSLWKAASKADKERLKAASDAAAKNAKDETPPPDDPAPAQTGAAEQQTDQTDFTIESAIAALRACGDDESRIATWKSINDFFGNEPPLDVEAVNNEIKEKFAL